MANPCDRVVTLGGYLLDQSMIRRYPLGGNATIPDYARADLAQKKR
jgi:hypothetical protein